MTEESRRQLLIISTAAMSLFLLSFDINMVNIALPTITTHHGLDVASSAWLVIAYGVVLCGLLLPFGKAGDVIGHRRLFIAGMGIFTVMNLAAGISYHLDDFSALIVFRGLSAIGTAMMVSVNFAIVSLNLPEEVRGKGLGYFSVFGAVGFMLGPLVSGLIITYIQWNWIFYLGSFIGLAGFILAWFFIPVSGGDGHAADILQTVAAFIAVLFSVLALNRLLIDGFTTLVMISMVMASAGVMITLSRQGRAEHPLLEPAIIGSPQIILPLFCMSFIYMTYSGSMVLLPFYLEHIQGLTPSSTGLLFLLPALLIIILGPLAGGYADRNGSYLITLTGTGVMVIAMVTFVIMGSFTGVAITVLGLMLMGVSHGLFNAPNNRRIFCIVPSEHAGTASGMHQSIRQVGTLIGVATMPAVYQMVAGPSPDVGSMVGGFEAGFLVGLIFAVMALGLSISIRQVCRG